MQITKTYWTQAEELVLTPDKSHAADRQPCVGFEVGWNIPKQWYRPFVIFHLWHIHFQIGWLAEYK